MKFAPKSLHGQVLLSVALALLLAQLASAVLLFRAAEERRAAEALTASAFILTRGIERSQLAESENGVDLSPRRRGRLERRGPRMTGALPPRVRFRQTEAAPVAYPEFAGEGEREASLRELLRREGIDPYAVAVTTRKAEDDPVLARFAEQRPRFAEMSEAGSRQLMIAAIQLDVGGPWLAARVLEPSRPAGALAAIIFQTLIIFLAVMAMLAFMLRRITRPLAALTKRVESFAGRNGTGEPLALAGPEDTRRLIAAHNAMESRIAALLDEKDVMLGAIGHDLKTPLAALRVRIESVTDETERARMAATIEDITSTLDDILSLARVGRPADPLEKTDLSALTAAVVEEFEDMGEDVALGSTEKIALPLRATWMRRALRNIIGNALRYGKHARIDLVREGSHAIIRVTDRGPGIPEDQIAVMLEPFRRGDTSRSRETGGAGLGLTLARAIAEQHGGTLTLANRRGDEGEGEGLLVELRLPL